MRHRVRDKRERNMYESCSFKTAERLTHYHVKFKLHARCFMPFSARSCVGPARAVSHDRGILQRTPTVPFQFSHKNADLLLQGITLLQHFLQHGIFFLVSVKIKCVSLVASKTSLLVYEDKKIALRILMNIGTKLCAWATET